MRMIRRHLMSSRRRPQDIGKRRGAGALAVEADLRIRGFTLDTDATESALQFFERFRRFGEGGRRGVVLLCQVLLERLARLDGAAEIAIGLSDVEHQLGRRVGLVGGTKPVECTDVVTVAVKSRALRQQRLRSCLCRRRFDVAHLGEEHEHCERIHPGLVPFRNGGDLGCCGGLL